MGAAAVGRTSLYPKITDFRKVTPRGLVTEYVSHTATPRFTTMCFDTTSSPVLTTLEKRVRKTEEAVAVFTHIQQELAALHDRLTVGAVRDVVSRVRSVNNASLSELQVYLTIAEEQFERARSGEEPLAPQYRRLDDL